MFYSHDVLSNGHYGVATVWLVATVGKGTQKKVNRKAIQDVNVPKACEAILDPGAPLALRLQGSLLYGVSRVYAHQCAYVLSDAEKTQSDMMTFFCAMQTNDIDSKVGPAKRHLITLQDDPAFDPLSVLPNLDLLNDDKDFLVPNSGTSTAKDLSQLTPLRGSHGQAAISSTDHPDRSFLGFDFLPSSHSPGSFHIPSDLGRRSSSLAKTVREADTIGDFRPFGDDEFEPMGGFGLDFDGDGNLIGILDADEPELPPWPGQTLQTLQVTHENAHGEVNAQAPSKYIGRDTGILNRGEETLPYTSPSRCVNQLSNKSPLESDKSSEATKTIAKSCRAPRRKLLSMIDDPAHVSKNDFRSWTESYAQTMTDRRKRVKTNSAAQARRYAVVLLFENGLGGIGAIGRAQNMKKTSLAQDFAGAALEAQLQGRFPDDETDGTRRWSGGCRRKAEEAFGDDVVAEGRRPKNRRGDRGPEFGRGDNRAVEDQPLLGDESAPEVGMVAGEAISEHHSSSLMPWSHQSSAVPGSSTHVPSSAQRPIHHPSPLLGRGNVIPTIDRYSDPAAPEISSDSIGYPQWLHSAVDVGGSVGLELDYDSQEFLGYTMRRAAAAGTVRAGTDQGKTWVDFEQLADPAMHTRDVAAHAFLHVLSLANKGVITVEQDGQGGIYPHGSIRLGVTAALATGAPAEEETE